ncbi:hypothetical protein Tco_1411773, partial [Tanacetum coccineum]
LTGNDHGVKAQGEGWVVSVAIIEGTNLAALDSSARAFRAGTKPDFILRGTLHPTVKWAEEDNEVDPDELSRIKKSEMLQGFGADLIGSRNDGNKVHIKIKGIASLEDMNTVKSLLDSLSTPKRSALFGLPKFLLWCCLKCMFLYFPAMFFKGQMREVYEITL